MTNLLVVRWVYLLLGVALARKDDDVVRDIAQSLLDDMTLDEKISLTHGSSGPYVGNVAGIPRLKIPPINMNDGPQGFRGKWGTSTAWPCALSMAATFDADLVYEWGKAMGKEFLDKGANVFLGPGVNVARIPRNGRNFEYLSGEDPVLGARLVYQEIKGLQEQGVIATVKHYVHNNQETLRSTINQVVDERTHWELYMPPFAAAVKAGVLSFMCSYNRVNGHHACENADTLASDLKKTLGFEGFVVSDWGATHSTVPSAKAGLDMEMPSGRYFADKLKEAIQSNQLSETVLDGMVNRILHALIASGSMNRTNTGSLSANVTSDEHNQLAREFAEAGVVLLKNDNHTLPLSPKQSVLVIGSIKTHGGGSGQVHPPYAISGYQGIQSHCDQQVYHSPMWFPDYSKVSKVDKVVIFTSTSSGEGSDRKDLSFPDKDLKVIDKLISMAPEKVIVVGTAPGAVLLPFADQVPALLLSFLPGQEAGSAIANVLYGSVNPSGRLPLTMPNKENEMNMTPEQYPGVNGTANYTEQLLVGYRWYDAQNVKPKYAFGFGLSYTTFAYSNLNLHTYPYSFQLTNTGSVDGYEVCQFYVWFPKDTGEPPKALKDFQRVFLKAGESKKLSFGLTKQDLSIWSIKSHSWEPVKGPFRVSVGPSSDNQPLQGTINNTIVTSSE